MQSFELSHVLADLDFSQRPWLEFLRVSSMSMGVYQLKAGEPDRQQPHTEDEVYFVVAGKGRFQAGTETCAVEPGRILYVPRGIAHRFQEITEGLTLLVFFAPPEGSQKES